MKSLWKKYDTSVIAVLVSVVFILITAFFNYYLAIAEILILGLLVWSKIAYSQNVRQKLLYNVQAVADTLDFEQGKLLEDYVECSRSLLAQNERNACELFQRDFVGD